MIGTNQRRTAGIWAAGLWTAACFTGTAAAEPATYNFADPKGVNGVMFVLDSELEPFVGIGGGITGEVTYQGGTEEPHVFEGSISLDATTLQLVNGRMTDVMFGGDWLNVEARPQITVTFEEIESIDVVLSRTDGQPLGEPVPGTPENELEFDLPEGVEVVTAVDTMYVNGTLSFGPATIQKTFAIKPTVIEDGGSERGAGEGDLLVLRCEFTVDRFDLGIENPGVDKVARSITVTVPIVGYAKPAE